MRTLYPIYGCVNQINTEGSKAGESKASLLLKGKDFVSHLTIHLEHIHVWLCAKNQAPSWVRQM